MYLKTLRVFSESNFFCCCWKEKKKLTVFATEAERTYFGCPKQIASFNGAGLDLTSFIVNCEDIVCYSDWTEKVQSLSITSGIKSGVWDSGEGLGTTGDHHAESVLKFSEKYHIESDKTNSHLYFSMMRIAFEAIYFDKYMSSTYCESRTPQYI